jgi:hypothetical protein
MSRDRCSMGREGLTGVAVAIAAGGADAKPPPLCVGRTCPELLLDARTAVSAIPML